MSQINVNTIKNKAGTGAPNFPNGATVTGVVTATSFAGNVTGNADTATTATTATNAQGLTGSPAINVGNITGTTATFSGNISVGGTITYDDVTSVDSVGIVTAREDLKVLRNFSTVGLSTFTGAIDANGTLDVAGALYCGGNINQSAGTFITQPGAGNAGIGTATTAHRLDVNGNIQAQGGNPSLYLKSNSTTGESQVFFGDPSTFQAGKIKYYHNGDYMDLRTGGSSGSFVRIDADGDIGVGTVTATSKLHTYSNASNGLQMTAGSYNSYVWGIQADGNLNNGSKAGELALRGQNGISFSPNGGTSTPLRITNTKDVIFESTAGLIEQMNFNRGKLGDALNIHLADGNIKYNNSNETTSGAVTVNLKYDGSTTFHSKVEPEQAVAFTIVYIPNGNMYVNNVTIDGTAVTKLWVGGAPTSAEGSGKYVRLALDVFKKTHTGVYNNDYVVICTQTVGE